MIALSDLVFRWPRQTSPCLDIPRLEIAAGERVFLHGPSGSGKSTLLAGLNERRRELAILRSLGAGPREIFLMLTIEGLLVTLLGCLLGFTLLMAGIALLAPLAQAQFGVHLTLRLPTTNEAALLFSIMLTGLAASLIPGWRAWRMSLTDGLTPRN